MSESERIRSFLTAVRRRLLLKAALETAGFGAAALTLALLALGATAASVGPAGFWPPVTAIALAVLVLGAIGAGVARPARALRDDR
ncbi:MAG: hypothetical protein JWM82_251, partial [Myxococcales bacterium]|nr:hypothetical protein [Myxococcales bacterium]